MSAVVAVPELMAEAATDLATVGSNLSAAHMTTAAATVTVLPAAADEVSTGIAQLFSAHAQDYQTLAGKAAAFNDQFVQHLTAGAFSYASIEANNAALLNGLTASVGAIGSAIGALPGQLLNDFATFVLNDFVTFVANHPRLFLLALLPIVGAPFLAIINFLFLLALFGHYGLLPFML